MAYASMLPSTHSSVATTMIQRFAHRLYQPDTRSICASYHVSTLEMNSSRPPWLWSARLSNAFLAGICGFSSSIASRTSVNAMDPAWLGTRVSMRLREKISDGTYGGTRDRVASGDAFGCIMDRNRG